MDLLQTKMFVQFIQKSIKLVILIKIACYYILCMLLLFHTTQSTTYSFYEFCEKGENMIKQVYKRDGTFQDYDGKKIAAAIFKAAQACGGNDRETSDNFGSGS